MKEVLFLININDYIMGDRVTHREFFIWLGILVFNIYHHRSIQKISFFHINNVMNWERHGLGHPTTYIDGALIRSSMQLDITNVWNNNMNMSFVVSYLDESSMLPRTKAYDDMYVQKNPCLLCNDYHSICCCISGLMYANHWAGYNRPRETFVDDTKIAQWSPLLLYLCKSIFHIVMVLIFDCYFCIFIANIVLICVCLCFKIHFFKKKRGHWTKYVDWANSNSHFTKKDIGDSGVLHGRMDNILFNILGMKEPDYVSSWNCLWLFLIWPFYGWLQCQKLCTHLLVACMSG